MKNKSLNILALALICAITTMSSYAQTQKVSAKEAKRTKEAGIADKVQTVAGELTYFDGVPTGNTNDLVYDYLDRARGVDVYLDNLGAVVLYSLQVALDEQGCEGANKVAIWEQLMDSRTPVLLPIPQPCTLIHILPWKKPAHW